MLELYHAGMSSCAQKVRLVLAEKQLDYVSHPLDLRAGDTHTTAYLALNPKGVVPTLIVDGAPIIESAVICEYLDDAFPAPALRPIAPLDRAAMRQWTIQPDAGLHAAIGTLSFAVAFRHQNLERQLALSEKNEVTRQLHEIRSKGLESVEFQSRVAILKKMLTAMSARLAQHDWLAGDRLSLADIAMLPYICRIRDLGQDWLWQNDPRFAVIARWLAAMIARPSYSAAITAWHDAAYLSLMREKGAEAEPLLRDLFA